MANAVVVPTSNRKIRPTSQHRGQKWDHHRRDHLRDHTNQDHHRHHNHHHRDLLGPSQIGYQVRPLLGPSQVGHQVRPDHQNDDRDGGESRSNRDQCRATAASASSMSC